MFDVERLKRESGLSLEQLAQLEEQVRVEFGEDELLRELHLVRVLEALRRGWITVKEALSAEVRVP